MEFFEALFTFVIYTHSEGFKEVAGTKLNNEFAAHQSDVKSFGWNITDLASGLAIAVKLPTLKACKEFIANMTDDMKERINIARQKPGYKEWCEKLAAWRPVEKESLDFDVVYEELNDLYKEDDQELLFNIV